MHEPRSKAPIGIEDVPTAATLEAQNALSTLELKSSLLKIRDPWTLEVALDLPIQEKSQVIYIDLREFKLPKVSFTRTSLCFADRPDFAKVVVRAIDNYMMSTRPSKSRHLTVYSIAHQIAKALEFGWINGIYSLSDWSAAAFHKLARALASGGWCAALQIESRIEMLLGAMTSEERHGLWYRDHSISNRLTLRRSLLSQLSTNIRTRELDAMRRVVALNTDPLVYEELAVRTEPVKRARSAAMLLSDLSAINLMMDAAESSYVPFPKPHAKAKLLVATPRGRTRSMEIDSVAELLSNSVNFLYKTAEPLIAVCEQLRDKTAKVPNLSRGTRVKVGEVLLSLPSLGALESAIGQKISSFRTIQRAGKLSLSEVIFAWQAAAFIVIAFMNARRKDEVMHPRVGLHAGAVRTIDDDLKIYQCEFYIEKSVRDYVPFYVNELTRDAIQYLTRLANVARDTHERRGGIKRSTVARQSTIFCVPQFNRSAFRDGLQWMNFNLSSPSRRFARRVLLGSNGLNSISPHMLRRAYALIFHYRYEHATLIALRQQLQHFDLATTQIYVTDTRGVEESGISKYGPLTAVQRRAVDSERQQLKATLDDVGRARLHQLVEEVLGGVRNHFGGYPRLVQRSHQALQSSVNYRLLDEAEQRKVLSAQLIKKGHAFHAMPHGNCMSGTTSSRLRGQCHSPEAAGPDRGKATAALCNGCAYFFSLEQHKLNLEKRRLALMQRVNELPTASLQSKASTQELQTLEALIEHQDTRMRTGLYR